MTMSIFSNDLTIAGFNPEDMKNLEEINEQQKQEGYALNEVGLRIDYPSTYLTVKNHFEEDGEIFVTLNLKNLQSVGKVKISLGYKKVVKAQEL